MQDIRGVLPAAVGPNVARQSKVCGQKKAVVLK